MDDRAKAEQDIISAADCWARGVMQNDMLLNLTEQNLLDAVMAYDRLVKRLGLDPSHLPPPPNVPHDMDVEDQIPTVRYSERSTVHSYKEIQAVTISEPVSDSDDIF
jgi:hypothetical protein